MIFLLVRAGILMVGLLVLGRGVVTGGCGDDVEYFCEKTGVLYTMDLLGLRGLRTLRVRTWIQVNWELFKLKRFV